MRWIEDLRAEHARRERAELLQLHRERVGQVKRPVMWRELVSCVKTQINMQRAMFAGTEIEIQCEPGGQAFTIRKSNFPCVTVNCQFSDERMIQIYFSYRPTDSAETLRWEDHIDFHVDELDRVQFEHKGQRLIDASEACLIVLLPIRDPLFRPPEGASPQFP